MATSINVNQFRLYFFTSVAIAWGQGIVRVVVIAPVVLEVFCDFFDTVFAISLYYRTFLEDCYNSVYTGHLQVQPINYVMYATLPQCFPIIMGDYILANPVQNKSGILLIHIWLHLDNRLWPFWMINLSLPIKINKDRIYLLGASIGHDLCSYVRTNSYPPKFYVPFRGQLLYSTFPNYYLLSLCHDETVICNYVGGDAISHILSN